MPSTDPRRGNRRGMALAFAVFALAVIGAVVAGGFMAAVLEHESGRNTMYQAQAAEAGEAELRHVLDSVPPGTLLALPTGGAPLDLGFSDLPGYTVERWVFRLAENLFQIRVRGARVDASGGVLASRAAGLFVRVMQDSLSGADTLVTFQRGWVQLY